VSRAELPPDLIPAGFVSRLIALVIDIVLVSLGARATRWIVGVLEGFLVPAQTRQLVRPEELLLAITPLFAVAYLVGLWRLTGQTIGKWLVGLRVVNARGEHVTTLQALLRLSGYVLSAIPLYAGFFWVLVDPTRRAWHDRLARTYVVYHRRARRPANGPTPGRPIETVREPKLRGVQV
jgi:uncharacterized RDD family membrane protein YckC